MLNNLLPPIILLFNGTKWEIVDGKQRLNTIRDFYENKFSIDYQLLRLFRKDLLPQGKETLYPSCDIFAKKYFFKDLPQNIQAFFRDYGVPVYQLRNYSKMETIELFQEIQKNVRLSAGEKLNARIDLPLINAIKTSTIDDVFAKLTTLKCARLKTNKRKKWTEIIAKTYTVLKQGGNYPNDATILDPRNRNHAIDQELLDKIVGYLDEMIAWYPDILGHDVPDNLRGKKNCLDFPVLASLFHSMPNMERKKLFYLFYLRKTQVEKLHAETTITHPSWYFYYFYDKIADGILQMRLEDLKLCISFNEKYPESPFPLYFDPTGHKNF